MKKYSFFLFLTAAFVGFLQQASAEELLTLSGVGEKGYHSGHDPIRIGIGKNFPREVRTYLHLEVDAIDVSAFLQRRADSLRYKPEEPLQPGLHELRVVALLPDGGIEELAVWTIEVRASKKFRVERVDGIGSIRVMNRVSDNLPDPPKQRTQAQGAAALRSQLADGSWTNTSEMNLFYNSQSEQNLSGDELELTDYRVQTDWSQTALTLGHHTAPSNSLVLNEFTRRGITGMYHSKDERVRVGAFGMRTDETVGAEDITGLEDPSQRTTGAVATLSPFNRHPERLTLSLIHLDGQGSSNGVAEIGDDPLNTGGTAQGLIAESYLGNGLWRIRGEMAQSNFDFDGLNTGFSTEEDEAYSVLFGYDTTGNMTRAGNNNWSVNLLHQYVGPWFHSLGNSTLAMDRKTTQLISTFQNSEIALNFTVGRNEDNVTESEYLPTTAVDSEALTLSYTPAQLATAYGEKSSLGPFANPSFTLGVTQSDTRQVRTPIDFSGDDVDYYNVQYSIASAFRGDYWYWLLSHSTAQQQNRTNSDFDTNTYTTSLNADVVFNPIFSFGPSLQFTETDYPNLDLYYNASLAGLRFTVNYPYKWSTNLSYTWSSEESIDGTMDTFIKATELATQWTYLQATTNRPGIGLLASASYQEQEFAGIESDNYQVYLGINVGWSR